MKKVNYLFLAVLFFAFHFSAAQTKESETEVALIDPITNCNLRYYYYPNLQAYFDTKTKLFIFCQKGIWIKSTEIPNGYMGYSLYNKVSVFITDYDDDDPTQFIKVHKKLHPYISASKRNTTACAE